MIPPELTQIIKIAAQDQLITSAEYHSIINKAKEMGADLDEVEKAIKENAICTIFSYPALKIAQERLQQLKMQKDLSITAISDYREKAEYEADYIDCIALNIEALSCPTDANNLRELYLFAFNRSLHDEYNDLRIIWEKKVIECLGLLLEILKNNQAASEEVTLVALEYNREVCNSVPRALEMIEILKAKAEEEYKATRPSLFQGWRFKLIVAGVVLAVLQMIFSWHVGLKTLLWITLIVVPIATWYLEAMRIRDMVYDKYHLREEANASNKLR